jgi:hypothetical protein
MCAATATATTLPCRRAETSSCHGRAGRRTGSRTTGRSRAASRTWGGRPRGGEGSCPVPCSCQCCCCCCFCCCCCCLLLRVAAAAHPPARCCSRYRSLWLTTRGGDLLFSPEKGVSEGFDASKFNSRGFGILDVGFKDAKTVFACGGSGSLFKVGGGAALYRARNICVSGAWGVHVCWLWPLTVLCVLLAHSPTHPPTHPLPSRPTAARRGTATGAATTCRQTCTRSSSSRAARDSCSGTTRCCCATSARDQGGRNSTTPNRAWME